MCSLLQQLSQVSHRDLFHSQIRIQTFPKCREVPDYTQNKLQQTVYIILHMESYDMINIYVSSLCKEPNPIKHQGALTDHCGPSQSVGGWWSPPQSVSIQQYCHMYYSIMIVFVPEFWPLYNVWSIIWKNPWCMVYMIIWALNLSYCLSLSEQKGSFSRLASIPVHTTQEYYPAAQISNHILQGQT